MNAPTYHILLCSSYRTAGEQQGTCFKKGEGLLQYIEEETINRGMDALVSSTGCVKMCEKGPVMIIYPLGWWYGEITEEKVDEILDGLEDGEPIEGLLFEVPEPIGA